MKKHFMELIFLMLEITAKKKRNNYSPIQYIPIPLMIVSLRVSRIFKQLLINF